MTEPGWDVIVVGAGNAGMCAAHAARERGSRVLVLEKADEAWSGGNSAFTAGAIRLAHAGLDDLRDVVEGVDDELAGKTDLDPYTEDDFLADMRRVTLGRGDEAMARILVGDSAGVVRWLHQKGLRFRLLYERQANEVDGRRRFWGGLALGTVDGGEGLMARHRAAAERDGIELRHDTAVEDLVRGDDGAVTGVVVRSADGTREQLTAGAVVLAAGGFESNPQMRAAHLGPNWDVAKVRGTPHNTGEVLRAALAHGAQAYGHWSGCHAIQWDAGAADRRSRADQPLLAPVLSGGDRRQRRRRALHRRGRGLPQLHLRQVRRRGTAPAAGDRGPDLRRPHRADAAHHRLRGARRDARGRRHPGRAGRGPGHRRAAPRADRRRVQRRDPGRRLRPDDQGRQADRGHRAAQVQLGAPGRGAAVHRVPDHVRDHLHLRRRPRRRGHARARRRRAAAVRPVRRRRARRGPLLPQLPGRHRADRRGRLGRRAGTAAALAAAARGVAIAP